MEDSKYNWIHREIILNSNLPVEATLLNLKEVLRNNLNEYQNYCWGVGLNICHNGSQSNCDGDDCYTLRKIEEIKLLLNTISDFIKENEIDIKSYEERRKSLTIPGFVF